MNKRGYTLIELIIAIFILINVIWMFFYIIKNTILFVDLNKQEILMFNNIWEIKSNINKLFMHDKINILPLKEISSSWVYSIKDNLFDKNNLFSNDTLSLYYEDKTLSWNTTQINSWYLIIWTIDKKNYKLILPWTNDYWWFFAYNYLKSSENINDYFITNSTWWNIINSYINSNINIKEFKYSLVNNWEYLRIDIGYDNDIKWIYKKNCNQDEYYFSWAFFLIKKIDL